MDNEKVIGYIEVFYYDEDDYEKYHINYHNNEDEAVQDFLSRSYAGIGRHNMCYLVGHGPSFCQICLERTIYHNDTRLHVKASNRFKKGLR